MDGRVSNERERELGRRVSKQKRRRSIKDPVRSDKHRSSLCRGLVLRGHAVADGHTGILATGLLLLLEVLIVRHLLLLLVGHVAGVHARTRHIGLRRIDVVADILGGLGRNIGSINTVLVGGRVRCVQACLEGMLLANPGWR